jgi:iron complex transport system substrate-binding protein
VTDYCDYPEAALALPKVGGFKGKSLEAIVGLSPDLVVGTRDGNEAGLFPALSRLGIRTLTVQPSTLLGVIDSIRVIGRDAGREQRSEELAEKLEQRLGNVRDRVKDAKRVRVLFVYGRDPLVLAGPGTFADDMIRWAGGVNVAGDAAIPYPRFSLETVLARAPEVIVEGAMGSEAPAAKMEQAKKFWSRLNSLPAAQSGRIAIIAESLIARPGPRIFDGLEILARTLHPELFPELKGEGA